LFFYNGVDYEFQCEPFYIGKGSGNRINEHDGEIRSKSRTRKANKIRKIWKETDRLHIKAKLFEKLTEDQALETEIFLIKQIGRLDHQSGSLTNATDGGDGSSNYSVDHLRNLSIRFSGKNNPFYGCHHSPKTIERLKESSKKLFSGINNPMCGKHHSQSTKEKISVSKFGIPVHSFESRGRLKEKFAGQNNPMYGRHHTDSAREKISANRSYAVGENHHFYGKTHSEEAKEKMRKPKSEETKRRISESKRNYWSKKKREEIATSGVSL